MYKDGCQFPIRRTSDDKCYILRGRIRIAEGKVAEHKLLKKRKDEIIMKALINTDKWSNVFTPEEYTKINKLTMELLSNATDRGNNYADILLAMHNAINDAVYDYELETE